MDADKNNIEELLNAVNRKDGYEVPEGYFEALPERIFTMTDMAEKALTPAPDGYFDTLPDKIMEQRYAVPQAKVRSMVVWKYAAAVVVIMLAAWTVWRLNQSPPAIQEGEWTYLEYLEKEIMNYDVNTLIENEIIDEEVMESLDITVLEDGNADLYLENNLEEIDENYLQELY